ncbi:MAG: sugar transferase [Owenweeksia sp.]|nr:sugar transferase [Owenweeksia sp.]
MYRYFKHLTDLVMALIIFLLLSPVFLLLFLIPRAIFRQERLGQNGKSFTIFKIRTMHSVEPGKLTADRNRVTKAGHFLRATGLDELPQVINILFGQMSFIGPRALPAEYWERIPVRYNKRFGVKPGISGLAQVLGRNQISWPQKFRLDCFYAKHQSPGLDLKILADALAIVLSGKAAYATDSKTMEELQPFE